jgi:hypothetical protein
VNADFIAMLGGLWLALPDTPHKDLGLSYPAVVCHLWIAPSGRLLKYQLWSMVKMFPKYPTLVQVSICTFFNASTSMCFAGLYVYHIMALLTGSWTTSTFLLSNDPYNYTPLKIGLLGLLGLLGAILAPLWGRLVDKIVPWSGQMLGAIMCLIAMLIALGAADINIAGVAIPLMLYDCGQ